MPESMISNEVAQLYARLRECIYLNDKAAVEQTCRDLLRVGRPLSEISQEMERISNAVKTLVYNASSAPRSYYWSQQWTARPAVPNVVPTLTVKLDRTIESDVRVGNPSRMISVNPDTEAQGSLRDDWIKQWQAQQQISGGSSDVDSAKPKNSDMAGESDLDSVRKNIWSGIQLKLTTMQDTSSGGISRFVISIASLYTVTVVVVSIGVFLFFGLAERKSAELLSRVENSVDSRASGEVQLQPYASNVVVASGLPARSVDAAGNEPDARLAAVPTTNRSADAPGIPVSSEAINESLPAPSPDPKRAALGPGIEKVPDVTNFGGNDRDAEESSTVAATPGVSSSADIVIKGVPASAASEAGPGKALLARPTRSFSIITPEKKLEETATFPVTTDRPFGSRDGNLPQADPDTAVVAKAVPISPSEPERREPATSTENPGVTTAPAETPAAKSTFQTNPREIDAAALLTRGDTLFRMLDVTSARLFYERAADAGSGEAAIRLGETFDPLFLARFEIKGVQGNAALALQWYQRARELGARDADILAAGVAQRLER